jgi:basic amino acid/polyamine antiporter, APA family
VAGPAFLLGLLIAGIVAAFNALNSAQLAARYPLAGGTYEYGYQVLHPWLGFSAGWMFLASKLAAGGTVALGFGSYIAALVPGLEGRLVAVVTVALLVIANLFGIRRAGRLNLAIVALTLAALCYLIVSLTPTFSVETLQPFAPDGPLSVVQSAALMFFAYTGYARLATLGEEVANPRATIPRAIVWSLAIATGVYLLVSLLAAGAVGAPALAATGAPLEVAAQAGALGGTRVVVIAGAASAMLGVLLSQIFGISRMAFAMARRRDLPVFLASVNGHGVPHYGVLLAGLALLAVAWFGALAQVAAAASFTILLYYAIANLAALRMDEADRLFPKWIGYAGLVSCLALAAVLPVESLAAGLALLATGLLIRLVVLRLRTGSSRSGA